MLTRFTHFLIALALWGSSLYGVNPPYQVPPDEMDVPQVAESTVAPDQSWEFLSKVSIFTPAEFTMHGRNHTTHFGKGFTGAPTLSLGIALPLFHIGNVQFMGELAGGLSTKKAFFDVMDQSGKNNLAEVRVTRAPITVTSALVYKIPGIWFVKPTLHVGVGGQWVSQSAAISDYDEAFWVPYLLVKPGLTFFPSQRDGDWFGGFTFGVAFEKSFSVTHAVQAASFEMTMHFML